MTTYVRLTIASLADFAVARLPLRSGQPMMLSLPDASGTEIASVQDYIHFSISVSSLLVSRGDRCVYRTLLVNEEHVRYRQMQLSGLEPRVSNRNGLLMYDVIRVNNASRSERQRTLQDALLSNPPHGHADSLWTPWSLRCTY